MILVLNILVIGIVALIAYWWANQGVLSSILHLVCVIAAGTIALAAWEPITFAMLNGGAFDNFAWGTTLIGTFALTLLILRFICDRLAPANVELPQWANLLFGGIAGSGSGVLTVGICLIGAGFIQSDSEIMGWRGWGRDNTNRAVVGQVGAPLWLPVTTLTDQAFAYLSVGTLRPDFSGTPLRDYNPRLDELSCLVRDTYDGGKGQISLVPAAATVTKVIQDEAGFVICQIKFKAAAMDFGGQLSLSSAQVRLVGWPSGGGGPTTVFPAGWQQPLAEGSGLFLFDDISHYASSVPGRKDADLTLAFEVPDGFRPRFLQVRGTRLDLPTPEMATVPEYFVRLMRGADVTPEEILASRPPMGYPLDNAIDVSSRIRKLSISSNGLSGSMEHRNNFLVAGSLLTNWTEQNVSPGLRIKGILSDEGTEIVQIKVSRGEAASIFELLPAVGPNAEIVLLDAKGNRYWPMGYFIDEGARIRIELSPGRPIRTIGELPPLPTSGAKKMTLLFQVTEGEVLRELRLGDVTIGTMDMAVRGRRR